MCGLLTFSPLSTFLPFVGNTNRFASALRPSSAWRAPKSLKASRDSKCSKPSMCCLPSKTTGSSLNFQGKNFFRVSNCQKSPTILTSKNVGPKKGRKKKTPYKTRKHKPKPPVSSHQVRKASLACTASWANNTAACKAAREDSNLALPARARLRFLRPWGNATFGEDSMKKKTMFSNWGNGSVPLIMLKIEGFIPTYPNNLLIQFAPCRLGTLVSCKGSFKKICQRMGEWPRISGIFPFKLILSSSLFVATCLRNFWISHHHSSKENPSKSPSQ